MSCCCICLVVAALIFLPLFILYLYLRLTVGRYSSDVDLTAKTVIITGANVGIGFETALDLATRNARIIFACRNLEKAEQAKQKIFEETGNRQLIVKHLDLASLDSVRKFSAEILKEENRLDILINNAGVVEVTPQKTKDGFEMMFGVNHLGHFLLTLLLKDLLMKSAPSRVVVVSSVAHMWAKITASEITADRLNTYNRSQYGVSKLMNILFTRELSQQWKDSGVTVNALHPGAVQSELLRNLPPVLQFMFDKILCKIFYKTTKEGAQTSIYVAVAPELKHVTGEYFSDCKISKRLLEIARDDGVAKKVWEISEQFCGLK
ncbi:retinol dehydrogenase 14-like [Tubulanus polymorphus]|uniref:retinol dehydrogenase 14-like n=1 Tax=Tubulanus polymorphus TaxID=672921 RepID=UPI003DA2574D